MHSSRSHAFFDNAKLLLVLKHDENLTATSHAIGGNIDNDLGFSGAGRPLDHAAAALGNVLNGMELRCIGRKRSRHARRVNEGRLSNLLVRSFKRFAHKGSRYGAITQFRSMFANIIDHRVLCRLLRPSGLFARGAASVAVGSSAFAIAGIIGAFVRIATLGSVFAFAFTGVTGAFVIAGVGPFTGRRSKGKLFIRTRIRGLIRCVFTRLLSIGEQRHGKATALTGRMNVKPIFEARLLLELTRCRCNGGLEAGCSTMSQHGALHEHDARIRAFGQSKKRCRLFVESTQSRRALG